MMATMIGFVARGLAVGEELWLRWCEQRHSKELPKLRGIIMLMIFALKNDIASSGRSRGGGGWSRWQEQLLLADFS